MAVNGEYAGGVNNSTRNSNQLFRTGKDLLDAKHRRRVAGVFLQVDPLHLIEDRAAVLQLNRAFDCSGGFRMDAQKRDLRIGKLRFSG